MNAPSIPAILLSIKPTLDKARAVADKADAAVNKANSSFGATLAKAIPGVGTWITALVAGCNVLDEVLDAIDSLVDANAAAPALIPAPPVVVLTPPTAK